MKNFSILFLALIVSTGLLGAKVKSKIDLLDDKDMSNAELRHKVRALQENVIDLEDRVSRLEAKIGGTTVSAPGATPTEPGKVTCFIETPFDGLFDATEINETKARVEAVKSCMSKVKSRIHCSAEKVKCGN